MERDKQDEIAFQKQLLAIKSRARPLTEEENQRLEDRVMTTLKQLRDSQQPSKTNGSVATTTADCPSEITSQSLLQGPPESSLVILPSCSMEHEKEELLPKERSENPVANTDDLFPDIKARLTVLEERHKYGWSFQ